MTEAKRKIGASRTRLNQDIGGYGTTWLFVHHQRKRDQGFTREVHFDLAAAGIGLCPRSRRVRGIIGEGLASTSTETGNTDSEEKDADGAAGF